ncbi:MAG TPA: PEGA domain-containing protein [Vicinamibacterales bacterium]|nr:PEGA domain-containing protein [Vicinamibacterales bacterium]
MERADSFIVDDTAPSTSARPGRASWYTPGLSDGLGDRLLLFDNSTASPLELLRFKREFSTSPAFEAALRQRVQQLEHFKHPAFGRVRAVEWLGAGEGLALVSNQTPGRRLSELVHEARGPTYARELIRQLAPALAALHQHDEGVAHGVLTADRIIVTPEGKLVIVEHVLGSALESLPLSANRLRSDLGLAVAPSRSSADGDVVALDGKADLIQLGFVALSLVIGRRVDPAEYPDGLAPLFDELIHRDGYGSMSALRLRWWLEHALQFDGRTFTSAREANEALLELPEDSDMQPAKYPKPATIHALPGPVAVPPAGDEEQKALAAPGSPAEDAAVVTTLAEPPTAWHRGTKKWVVVALATVAFVEGLVIGGLIYQRRAAAASSTALPPLVLVESDIPGAQVVVDGKKSATPVMLNVTPGMRSIHLVGPDTAGPAAAAAPDAAAGATGQLEITSDPAGARITIDGARRGVTPLTLPLAPGQHSVIVSDGTTTTSRTVTIAAGATSTVMAAMAPAGAVAGWLTLSAPFELQVIEGGNLVGTTSTPKLMLSAGHHDLQLKNAALGFDTKVPVEIQAGKTLTAPVAIPNGSLSVNALPWANVSLDGKDIGTTPIANLDVPLGTHELVFRHPQLGERRQSVVVTAKAPVRVVQDLRK